MPHYDIRLGTVNNVNRAIAQFVADEMVVIDEVRMCLIDEEPIGVVDI